MKIRVTRIPVNIMARVQKMGMVDMSVIVLRLDTVELIVHMVNVPNKGSLFDKIYFFTITSMCLTMYFL